MTFWPAILYVIVIATVFVGQCLLALWAATSPRPLFTRSLVLWVAIAPLIPIRAYFPALFFTMTAALTFVIVWTIRRWQSRLRCGRSPTEQPLTTEGLPSLPAARHKSAWRFSLGDMFALIVFLATLIALSRYFPIPIAALFFLPLLGLPFAPVLAFAQFAALRPRPWMLVALCTSIAVSTALLIQMRASHILPNPIEFGLYFRFTVLPEMAGQVLILLSILGCIALIVLFVRQIQIRPHHPLREKIIVIALAATVAITILLIYFYHDVVWFRFDPKIFAELRIVGLHATPSLCLAAIVASGTWLTNLDWPNKAKPWRLLIRYVALGAVALAALPMSWLYWQMLRQPPIPPPPIAAVNHFDRIMAISGQLWETYIASQLASDYTGQPRLDRTLADQAIELLATANHLDIPQMENSRRRTRRTARRNDMQGLPEVLMQLAEQAAAKTDFDRGADYALARVRFGTMLCRGGDTLSAQSGMEQQIGPLLWLVKHDSQCSSAKRREVLETLVRSLHECEDDEILYARGLVFFERNADWQHKLMLIVGIYPVPSAHEYSMELLHHSELWLRSAILVLAIRHYEATENKLPPDLTTLVPDYLPSLPLDPFSIQPFVYRPAGTKFVLYSVGRDCTDNGGQFDDERYPRDAGYDLDMTLRQAFR